MPILSRNIYKKSIETVFLIAICHLVWQSKTLLLSIFDPHSLIVDNIFDCRLPDVLKVKLILPIGTQYEYSIS